MRALLLSSLFLAACSGERASQSPGTLVTSLAEVRGDWDIARFDGYTPTRLHGGSRRAFVTIGKDGLGYSIECNYSGNPARIDGKGVLHDLSEPAGSRISTMALCGGEADRREGRLFSFFARKPTVRWEPNGSLRLHSGQSELILERPEQRRLANLPTAAELTDRWVPGMAVQAEDESGIGYSGYGFQQPSLAVITPTSLSYSGCGGLRFTFRLSRDGRLTDVRPQGREGDCGSDSASRTLFQVMTGEPQVERDSTGLAITSGRQTITLEREADVRRREVEAITPPPRSPPSDGLPHPVPPPAPPRPRP